MISIGQVYKDKDRRRPDRFLRVVAIADDVLPGDAVGVRQGSAEGKVFLKPVDGGGNTMDEKKSVRVSVPTLKRRFTMVDGRPSSDAVVVDEVC